MRCQYTSPLSFYRDVKTREHDDLQLLSELRSIGWRERKPISLRALHLFWKLIFFSTERFQISLFPQVEVDPWCLRVVKRTHSSETRRGRPALSSLTFLWHWVDCSWIAVSSLNPKVHYGQKCSGPSRATKLILAGSIYAEKWIMGFLDHVLGDRYASFGKYA